MTDTTDTLAHLPTLLVEDNAFMLGAVFQVLRSFGMQRVEMAGDGREAIARFRQMVPALVITDWNMPGMSGLELLNWIRQAPDSPHPEAGVIMLTASNQASDIVRARDAGVSEFLIKPVTPAAIRSRIDAIVTQPRVFFRTKDYVGPCRRRRRIEGYAGKKRRADDHATQDGGVGAEGLTAVLQRQIDELVALAKNLDPRDRKSLKKLGAVALRMGDAAHGAGDAHFAELAETMQRYVAAQGMSGAAESDIVQMHISTMRQLLTLPAGHIYRSTAVASLKKVVETRARRAAR